VGCSKPYALAGGRYKCGFQPLRDFCRLHDLAPKFSWSL